MYNYIDDLDDDDMPIGAGSEDRDFIRGKASQKFEMAVVGSDEDED